MKLRAPYPFFGCKHEAAPLIEALMGPIVNLVVPFAGSLGELLGRSAPAKVETVNDLDGLVVNAWRAMVYSPARLAELCDHPVHEAALHAAHERLISRADQLQELMLSDPRAHDVVLAAWWIWGASCWIGRGWCQRRDAVSNRKTKGRRVRVDGREGAPYHGQGVCRPWRARPQLSHGGQGVAKRQIPLLRGSDGTGVGYGAGINTSNNRDNLVDYFRALSDRLRWVRITCFDWSRLCTPSVTTSHGLTGVSLDPNYSHQVRAKDLYRIDEPGTAADVRAWALESGDDPLLRITLCGKYDEHDELLEHGWSRHEWRKDGEVIWASPRCTAPSQLGLWGDA